MFNDFQEVETFFAKRKTLGIKPGLERVKALLRLLDNPQDKIKAIHIAGTNGKGSTLYFLKDALQANGYHVGVFTSPSFSGLTGHMFKDGCPIPEETFVKLCNVIYPAVIQLDNRDMAPTEFEIMTALAFVYFSTDSDIVLIEAGMGGREDTTNCFQPILSIITNVALDHTTFLGDRLENIAYHKAGIIKKSAPVIVGDLKQEAIHIIDEEVLKKQTKCYQLGKDFIYKKLPDDNHFLWSHDEMLMEGKINMRGVHQMENASLAYMALILLRKAGFKIDVDKAINATRDTQIPGRFEVVHEQPVIILDGAHNPAGIQSFLNTVHDGFANKEIHLIFAAFKDKDLETMLEQLQGQFSSITLTTFNHFRAADVKDFITATGEREIKFQRDWQGIIEAILTQQTGYYFITGSLHFITAVSTYLSKINNN